MPTSLVEKGTIMENENYFNPSYPETGVYPLTVGEGIVPLTVGEGIVSLTVGNDDYSIPNYGDWYPYTTPDDYYKPCDYFKTYPTYSYFPYTPAIQKSNIKHPKKDLPVAEIQVVDQYQPIIIKKVQKIVSDECFVKITYKEGRSIKTMMIPEKKVVAIHKTGE